MLFLLALTVGCSPPPSPNDSGPSAEGGTPTWNADIAPLVGAYCVSCHTSGGYGGFDLTDYETARAMSEPIRAAVVNRTMPPWLADGDCNNYQYDISLDDDQIALIENWVEAGSPEGDPQAEPKSVSAPEERVLSRVDRVLTMDAPYTPVLTPDEYRCFVLDWPYEEDVYVTGFSLDPDNMDVVHHGIAFIIDPTLADEVLALDAADEAQGYECFGGPGVATAEDVAWIGAWAPGGAAGDMPEGTGIGVSAGSKIVLQVHFNAEEDGAVPAQVAMELMIEETVDSPALIQPWANPGWLMGGSMSIPPQSEGVVHDFSYTLTRYEFKIHYSALHMHRQGVSGKLWKTDANGNETCLLEIPGWDFDWQRSYLLEEPITASPGDTLTVECTFDNPTDEEINWGDSTSDEMCLGLMYITAP
jgi:mono/diheme cytochrome c family protein